MSREAMQMALEALEANLGNWAAKTKAISVLRQALETEQEPVAYINVEQQKIEWAKPTLWDTPTTVNLPKIPLYTAPPKQWVGLTDGEVYQAIRYQRHKYSVRGQIITPAGGLEWHFAKAIEQALKEKNT